MHWTSNVYKRHPTIKFKSLCLFTTELSQDTRSLANHLQVSTFCTPQLYHPTICVGTVKCKSSLLYTKLCWSSREVRLNFLKITLCYVMLQDVDFCVMWLHISVKLKRVMVNRRTTNLCSLNKWQVITPTFRNRK